MMVFLTITVVLCTIYIADKIEDSRKCPKEHNQLPDAYLYCKSCIYDSTKTDSVLEQINSCDIQQCALWDKLERNNKRIIPITTAL